MLTKYTSSEGENIPYLRKFVQNIRVMPKSYRLEVRPRSTSDQFPGRVIIGSCWLIAIWRTIPVPSFAIYQKLSDLIEPDMNTVTCFTSEE